MKKVVLITGGTGFLGRKLGIALKSEYEIVLCGRNNKLNLLAKSLTGCEVAPMDVTSIESVRDNFAEYKPEIVIHAAATKFVDNAERFPMECIDTNVIGAQNVARAAISSGVETVVGISTDKASPPVRNTYGLSKAMMERIFCSLDGKTDTRFSCVRYGNVAWSTGSVFPIWQKMHRENGLIRTTGPDMRRFFFTVDDAVQLVITCLSRMEQFSGRVLSRKMKAAKLRDILDEWIVLYGGRYEKVGERPGEREDEFLVGDIELPFAREDILLGIPHYVISFNERVLSPLKFGLSSANAEMLTKEEIIHLIKNPPSDEALH